MTLLPDPVLDRPSGVARGADGRVAALPPLGPERVRRGEHTAVLGAPGSGKTTFLVDLVVERARADGLDPAELLVLAPTRLPAADLRDRIGSRLSRPLSGPVARTPVAVALAVVASQRAAAGLARPRLLTGARQDELLRDLVEGEIEDGAGAYWPPELDPEVRRTRGFRSELRDLVEGCVQAGVAPRRLAALGRERGRPEWGAVARFLEEAYLPVRAQTEADALSAADALREAADILWAVVEGRLAASAVGDWARVRLVVVDDAQDLPPGAVRLLSALGALGADVVVFGDPDVGTAAFRGARPDLLGRLGAYVAGPGGRAARTATLVLDRVHRHGDALRVEVARVTARIGTAAGGTQRAAAAAADSPASAPPEYVVAHSAAEQARFVAWRLRERHLLEGVPWERMAVVARSRGIVRDLSRRLAALEVPTRELSAGTDFRVEPVTRALLAAAAVATGRRALDAATAEELLLSPLGGFDPQSLRALRRVLRDEDRAAGLARSAEEAVIEALTGAGPAALVEHRLGRRLARLARALESARERADRGGSAEEVLWELWRGAGRADDWVLASRRGDAEGAEADRLLDAAVALFYAAKRFAEQQSPLPAAEAVALLAAAELPEDTLAPGASRRAVVLSTPQGLVGREFDVVVVAGVQDGVWPDPRVRGDLLGASELVDVADGRDPGSVDARREVLHDERRLFAQAISRARRELVVVAVRDEEQEPSAFFPDDAGDIDLPVAAGLSLRTAVGGLRRELTRADAAPGRRRSAARALARLAAAGVAGADPDEWYGVRPSSSAEPLRNRDADGLVVVRPSGLESFETSPIEWAVDHLAGYTPSARTAIGTVLHRALETAAGPDDLAAEVDRQWDSIPFEASWQGEVERRRMDRVVGLLASYLRAFEASGGRLVAAERSFRLRVGEAVLSGQVDRLESRVDPDGSRVEVVVDLKSGQSGVPSLAEARTHAQLSAYQYAFAAGALDEGADADDLRGRAGGAMLLYLPRDAKSPAERAQDPLTPQELAAVRERIEAAAAGMSASSFCAPLEDEGAERRPSRARIHLLGSVSEATGAR